jgi:hypothetical protein
METIYIKLKRPSFDVFADGRNSSTFGSQYVQPQAAIETK